MTQKLRIAANLKLTFPRKLTQTQSHSVDRSIFHRIIQLSHFVPSQHETFDCFVHELFYRQMADNDLNKCNAHFFEGVEKLLEVWFKPSYIYPSGLRRVKRAEWEKLLKKVKCEIISYIQNDYIDAYVLSESSMFVTNRRWILKTCGSTTPLKCLKSLLRLATKHGCGEVEELFYSRKNFARPELQVFPHRGFSEETSFLDAIFEGGRSYCLGSINRDCWYLYAFSKYKGPIYTQKIAHDKSAEPDQTIEILMKDLDYKTMSIFSKEHSTTAANATAKVGIHHIIPDMRIDDYLFDPCGYSMNGISNTGQYMTIHITPEKDFSYVSFESNIGLPNYATLINRVIKMFQPTKFIITIFANKASQAYASIQDLEYSDNLSMWRRMDMQYSQFPTYNFIFAQYCRASVDIDDM